MIAPVVRTTPDRQRIEGSSKRRPGNRVEDAIDTVHSIEQRADLQPAPLEVSFTVFLEAFGIGDRPGVAAADAQMLDREPAREAHHLLFALGVHPVAQLLSQMADGRGRLVSDLTLGERLGHLRQ